MKNPYSFLPTLKFGALFVAILGVTRVAANWGGDEMIYATSALAGFADTSVVALSVGKLTLQGEMLRWNAGMAVLLAWAANAVTKAVISASSGARVMTQWLLTGLLLMFVVAFGSLWFMGSVPGV